MVGRVGSMGQQRMALLTDLVRADLNDPSETGLQERLLQRVKLGLAQDEMPIFDAGFKIADLYQAGLSRFVVRLAKNFTARRNYLPAYSGERTPCGVWSTHPSAGTHLPEQADCSHPTRSSEHLAKAGA